MIQQFKEINFVGERVVPYWSTQWIARKILFCTSNIWQNGSKYLWMKDAVTKIGPKDPAQRVGVAIVIWEKVRFYYLFVSDLNRRFISQNREPGKFSTGTAWMTVNTYNKLGFIRARILTFAVHSLSCDSVGIWDHGNARVDVKVMRRKTTTHVWNIYTGPY